MKYFIIAFLISVPGYYHFVIQSHEEFVQEKYQYQMRERDQNTPPAEDPQYRSPLNHHSLNPYSSPYDEAKPTV